MQRRVFIQKGILTASAIAVSKYSFPMDSKSDFPVVRISEAQRKFKSKAVEKLIADVKEHR